MKLLKKQRTDLCPKRTFNSPPFINTTPSHGWSALYRIIWIFKRPLVINTKDIDRL